MKVSVIVPAYNPGPDALDQLVGSLTGQSLPNEQYEIIVVDDASTDGSGELLDQLAARHENLAVIHNTPNSGWPGRPRNLGIDVARGEFLYFVDADDWLEPEALERMYDYALANDSDIVWGKVVGEKRSVPHVIFAENIPDARLGTHPLLALLTVHKMFRTSMVREHGIRFPEGRVRLEDHLFVMAAYFAARKISVLADYSCYHWTRRDDGSHISSQRDDPVEYFGSVRRVLDVVDANTEPGELRDRLTAHWWGGKSLAWFESGRLDRLDAGQARALFDTVRELAAERFPPALDVYLPPRRRVTADLLRRGDLDGLSRFTAWAAGIGATVTVTELAWHGSELHLVLECAMHDAAATPLRAERHGDTVRLALPAALALELSDPAALDVPRLVDGTHVRAYLRSRSRGVTVPVPTQTIDLPSFGDGDGDGAGDGAGETAELRCRVSMIIDCGAPAVERVADPVADLLARFYSGGWLTESRPIAPAAQVLAAAAAHQVGAAAFTPYGTEHYGKLSLRRAARPASSAPREADGIIGAMAPVPGKPDRPGKPGKPGGHAARPTLARRAGDAAARLGLPVTTLFPGVSVVSRRNRTVTATPLGADLSVVAAGKRSARVAATPLADDVSVFSAGKRRADVRPLTERSWLVNLGEKLSLDAIGKRGWLLSKPDPAPRAELDLETQVLKHFVDRHVAWLLEHYQVDLVIDVGANTGQYATALRKRGYQGHIASFEPVPAFAEALQKKAAKDDRWSIHPIALGSEEGTVPMTVQRTFSSLLKSTDYGRGRFTTLREFSDAEPVDVPVRRLDAILDDLLAPVRAAGTANPRIYLKMDTQGFDLQAFRGLGDRVAEVVALQSEVALLLIYEGMPRMPEAVATYESAGFEISGLYPVTREKDGRIIEYDCVMVRAGAFPG